MPPPDFQIDHDGRLVEVTLMLMPYYLAVAVIYGGLAYLTNSILPGLVLHAGGNVLAFIHLVAHGHPEWQASASRAPLVWETGPEEAGGAGSSKPPTRR